MHQPSLLAAHDEHHLGVCLVPHNTIDDMGAGLLQGLGKADVVRLVKTGTQLDHDGDLLAGVGRLDQGIHHGRVGAGAVKGLLDGQDLRVAGRGA